MDDIDDYTPGSKRPFTPYVKLFCRILDSSIWRQDLVTRIVWITLLAMKDMNGYVMASRTAIADRARVSDEECARALKVLSSPDPDSTTKAYEGRRIVPYEDGWYVVTHEKYRRMMSDENRKAYKAAWMRERRRRQKIFKGPTNAIAEGMWDNRERYERDDQELPESGSGEAK